MDRERRHARDLAAIDSVELLRLYDYWEARHRGDLLPSREDIDPMELRFILGNLILVDVLRDPLRFRYRLVGSNVSRRMGIDLTGKLLDEHPDPTFRSGAIPIYTEVANTARPYARQHDTIMDGRLRRYQVLLLPLAADGRTVDVIAVGIWFTRGGST